MVEYKVGALSQLIADNDRKELDDLFKAVEKPTRIEVEPIKEKSSDETPSLKRKSSENGNKSTPPKKKAKKTKKTSVKKEGNEDDDEEDEIKKYTQPSRKFQINNEEKNKNKERDSEQEARTVFIGNLPGSITTKTLKNVFAEIGKIETIRLRGAARPDLKTTKKQAIIQRKFHEKQQNIIAYIRFEDEKSVKKALKLNSTKIEDNIIR